MESEGTVRGLAVRDTKKTYGSCRLIEGCGSRDEPVVIIDDSISSGKSLKAAVAALESEGYQVEGALCLVEFPWRGGTEWARALGYRVETLFSIWDDLKMPIPPYVPTWRRIAVQWETGISVPNDLDPTTAARWAARHIQCTGRVPLPPHRLDRPYRAGGGIYVSFRNAVSNERIGRDGFWHFNPLEADVCRDIVLATAKTMRSPRLANADLDRLKIGISMFGDLEPVSPSQLDYDRCGIVVRSRVYPTKVGGALPNTQVFTSEVEQYRHARAVNAQIPAAEPHELFRHTVEKYVEPGTQWLPFGAPDDRAWRRDLNLGRVLTERARRVIDAAVAGTIVEDAPLSDELVPAALNGVAVTLWRNGVRGCWITWDGSLDDCLKRAALGALKDPRFAASKEAKGPMAVSVSLLHDRESHGVITAANAARKIRRGRDTVAVRSGSLRGVLLSHVAVHHNLDKMTFAQWALRKARIEGNGDSAVWSTLQTSTWLLAGGNVRALDFGFPVREGAGDEVGNDQALRMLADYIARHRREDGLPAYCYHPVTGREVVEGTAGRVLHALTAMVAAAAVTGNEQLRRLGADALQVAVDGIRADDELRLELPRLRGGRMAEAQLLASVARTGIALESPKIRSLANGLSKMLQDDGSITPSRRLRPSFADHDFFPGVVLLALASYANASGDLSILDRMERQFKWYTRRFRLVHPWGMVGWHPQAWALLARLSGRSEYAAFAFEIVDWALQYQHLRSGAFLSDLDPEGMSFHTAFLAEGVGEAARLAAELGDDRRARQYAGSVRLAWRFMQELLIGPDDLYCMANPILAVGGIRGSRTTSWVRIDFVSHTLEMLLKLHDISLDNRSNHGASQSEGRVAFL
jgi:AMMECR1 domain-containing protein